MALPALSVLILLSAASAGGATPSSAYDVGDKQAACGEADEEAGMVDETALIQRIRVEERKASLQGGCNQTSFKVQLGNYSHTYKLEKSTDGKEVSQPCRFGPYTFGNVTFKCVESKFSADRHSCSEPVTEASLQGGCDRTSLKVQVGNYSHTYELEKSTDGKEWSQPCRFGPYTLGNVTFKCVESKFSADRHSCSEPVAEGSCAKRNIEYKFEGHANVYDVPEMVDGATSTHPCAMGNYTIGEVVFKCAKGRLSVAKQSCAKPATAEVGCNRTSLKVHLGGYSHTYELEKTTDGKEWSQPCSFGPYTLGNVTFKCVEGKFGTDRHSCSEPGTEESCAKTNVEYVFDGHANVYNLPKMMDGATSTHPCAMGNYTIGEVVFECAKGRLGVAKQTCAEPAKKASCGKIEVTANIEDHSVTYKLRESANGQKQSHQCDAGPYTVGEVIFTCENGKFINSNTCMTQEQHEMSKALGPGHCTGVLYRTTLSHSAGNVSHTYKLDMMKNGDEATPQCAMGDYTAGEVVFKCVDGHVKWMSHSCRKKTSMHS